MAETRRIPGGLFIAFEGGEGAGKSSVAKRLAEELTSKHYEVTLTREPGGTELGEQLRSILLSAGPAGGKLDGVENLLLFSAARHNHVRTVISPALKSGGIVLCDRFVLSSKVYQGVDGVPAPVIDNICEVAVAGILPHVTLWFDVEPATGLGRVKAQGRAESSSYDNAKLEYHERIHAGFKAHYEQSGGGIVRINANSTPGEVYDEALAAIQSFIKSKNP